MCVILRIEYVDKKNNIFDIFHSTSNIELMLLLYYHSTIACPEVLFQKETVLSS